MIRLVLILLCLVIVWLLFIANLSRTQRIVAVILTCVLFVGAVWFDDNRKRPKTNLVLIDDVVNCGIEVSSPYRSNFEFNLCFENQAERGTVRRLSFEILAHDCKTKPCTEIETVLREIPVTIPTGERTLLKQSLKFDAVAALAQNSDGEPDAADMHIQWSLNLVGVKAIPE